MNGFAYFLECFKKRVDNIPKRDVETYNEDRFTFLTRVNNELNIGRTVNEIKQMIDDGMSDDIILNDKITITNFKKNYGLQRFI